MTRHDAFSYGQVQLGGGEAPAATDPDDLLFAEANAPKAAADSSWGLLDEDVDSLLPGGRSSSPVEFGSETLGEAMQQPPAPPPTPSMRARPAASPRPTPASASAPLSSPARAGSAVRHQVGARPAPVHANVEQEALLGGQAATAGDTSPTKNRVRKTAPPYMGRRRSWLPALLMPMLLFAGGGTLSAWFYAMQQNIVMAGIVGLLTLVSAMFSSVLLRS